MFPAVALWYGLPTTHLTIIGGAHPQTNHQRLLPDTIWLDFNSSQQPPAVKPCTSTAQSQQTAVKHPVTVLRQGHEYECM